MESNIASLNFYFPTTLLQLQLCWNALKKLGCVERSEPLVLEIMVQFILESVILSVLGGVSAIAVQSLTQLTPASIMQGPYRFSWQNAALSMGLRSW